MAETGPLAGGMGTVRVNPGDGDPPSGEVGVTQSMQGRAGRQVPARQPGRVWAVGFRSVAERSLENALHTDVMERDREIEKEIEIQRERWRKR